MANVGFSGSDPLWDQPFPAEQARNVQLLVRPDRLELRLRTQGLGHVMQELGAMDGVRKAA